MNKVIEKKDVVNIFNEKVSVYRSAAESREPICAMTLRRILGSEMNKQMVIHHRALKALGDDVRAKEVKKTCISAFSPEGVFATRCKSGLLVHSGIMCIDIDHVKDVEAMKSKLKNIPYIAYAAVSVGGNGLFALIPILDHNDREGYFKAMQVYFAEQGIEIDAQCSDVSRLRIGSYDVRPLINRRAQIWTKCVRVPKKQMAQFTPSLSDCNEAESLFFAGLKYIERTNTDITAIRGRWLNIASCVKSLFGEQGREYFHRLSRFHKSYKSKECDELYSGAADNGYSIGVFLNACTRAGVPKVSELLIAERRGTLYA